MNHDFSRETDHISDRGLLWTVGLNVALTAFQVMAGAISGSIALVADALHNLNDAAALVIAYFARMIARKRADARFTFGYRRAELIGATINLTAVIVIGVYLISESVIRLLRPEPILGIWVMAAAGIALVIDVAAAWFLWATSQGGVNLRSVLVHNLSDAFASAAVLAGGAAVYYLGWGWVDPVLTLMIAGYVLAMSWVMLRKTAALLMEGTPVGLELGRIQREVETLPGVLDVHHLHVWGLDEGHRALEAHVVLHADSFDRMGEVKSHIKKLLLHRFHVTHSTLEFERRDEHCIEGEAGLIPRHG